LLLYIKGKTASIVSQQRPVKIKKTKHIEAINKSRPDYRSHSDTGPGPEDLD
jgi:hypothetical protein